MPAFDVARRWKGRVVLDRGGSRLGEVLDVFYDAETTSQDGSWSAPRATPAPGWSRWPRRSSTATSWAPGLEPGGRLWPQEEADLYAYYGLPYTGASLADLDEEDEEDEEDAAVAQLRGLPPGR